MARFPKIKPVVSGSYRRALSTIIRKLEDAGYYAIVYETDTVNKEFAHLSGKGVVTDAGPQAFDIITGEKGWFWIDLDMAGGDILFYPG